MRRRRGVEEDDQGNSGEKEQEVMWKIREWRGGGSGEKEGDPERRGRVEKKLKSTCNQQFTRKEKGALSQTLKFNMI